MLAIGSFSLRLEAASFPTGSVQVRALRGRERISELFGFDVEIVSSDAENPTVEQMLGASVSLVFERGGVELRRVTGIVTSVEDGLDPLATHRSFALHVAPNAWRATMVETQAIYLDISVPDLIRRKLDLLGLPPEVRLLGNYDARDMIVQYRESDLAFVSRIAEHLGISYFFEPGPDGDAMVFTDHNAGFLSRSDEPIEFRARGEEREIFSLRRAKRAVPAIYVVQDYNYRNPLIDLSAAVELSDAFGGGVIEYGTHLKTQDDAKVLADVRAQASKCASDVFFGEADVCWLTAGARVRLLGHPILGEVELLVTEVDHTASFSVLAHGGESDKSSYRCAFRAIRADVPFRPARNTPRPRVSGILSGFVQAVDVADQARLDAKGRYEVAFHFDASSGAGRVKPSRLLRMAQPHAGPGYGIHFPLKPGTEVLMAFIDGDPDRPIIVGAVPNEVTPSPVTSTNAHVNQLKTVSGILIELDDRA